MRYILHCSLSALIASTTVLGSTGSSVATPASKNYLRGYVHHDCRGSEIRSQVKNKAHKYQLSTGKLHARAYRCDDNSISFDQPPSTGFMKWNGYCGETAVANVVFDYCDITIDPAKNCSRYFSDITPGNKPSTLR